MSGTVRKLCLLTIQGVYLFCSNEDDELERRRQIEAVRLEEEKKRKEEEYQREREKWRKKKEECSKRASKFADLKRRRVEERKKQEEAKKILEKSRKTNPRQSNFQDERTNLYKNSVSLSSLKNKSIEEVISTRMLLSLSKHTSHYVLRFLP